MNKFIALLVSTLYFNISVPYVDAQTVSSKDDKSKATVNKQVQNKVIANDKSKQKTKEIAPLKKVKFPEIPKIAPLSETRTRSPQIILLQKTEVIPPKVQNTGTKKEITSKEIKTEPKNKDVVIEEITAQNEVPVSDTEIKTTKSKEKNDYVDDLDISTYSYLDNIETSIELLNLILKSDCSKNPDNCKDSAILAKAAKEILDELKLKHPIGSRLISESQAKYLLMNALTLKDQMEEKNVEKISQLKNEIKNVNQFLYKEKEEEIIKRWKDSQIEAAKKTEVTIPEVVSSVQDEVIKEKTVFVSERDGNPEIYTMNPDGTNQVRLTNNEGYDLMPVWSPDGTKIAFVSERDGNPEIYVMNHDGSEQTRLTDNSAYDYSPVWSPDGTKIAFVSNRESSQSSGATVFKIDYKIFVMNADGSNQTKLTENSVADESPKWSPDGTKIAFVSKRDGNAEIYAMNSDGTNTIRLTDNSAFDLMPNWSPDGTKIAFRADRDGNPEIYIMNADGTNQVRLTDNTVADEYPSWSPDGTKIIFVSKRDNVLDNFGILTNEIYVMNADGTNIIRLTNNSFEDYFPNISKPGNGTASPLTLK